MWPVPEGLLNIRLLKLAGGTVRSTILFLEITKDTLKSIKENDRRVVKALYSYSFNVLMSVAVRYKNNTEDQMTIVNNAFIKIVTKIDSFQPGTAYFSWIKRIATNEVINEFRRNKNYLEMFNELPENAQAEGSVRPVAEDAAEEEYLQGMLDRLPPATKMVFNLYAIEGYSFQEICSDLGISYETAKWHVREARKKLKDQLKTNRLMDALKTGE